MANQRDDNGCRVCGGNQLNTFLDLPGMPAQDGVVFDSKEQARKAPTGDICLALCTDCGYIGNIAYDPERVGFAEYRYAQHHSPKYREHIDNVIAMLDKAYGIRNKTVVDVGCGYGYFLKRICAEADNHGIGIDPSAVVDEDDEASERITMIRDYYGAQHAHHKGDLVTCNHVIDELEDPYAFLKTIAGSMSDTGEPMVYLEMPNAMRTLEQKLVWNIGYAKNSWFTPPSLRRLYRECGLQALAVEELLGGEYLGVIGRRASEADPDAWPTADELGALNRAADGIEQALADEVTKWTKRSDELKASGKKVAIWGAGMRGINFLSRFGDEAVFQKIVDINPDRQGYYLPVCGYYVDAPESLKAFAPDVALLSNPNYEQEIAQQLREMGVDCAIERL